MTSGSPAQSANGDKSAHLKSITYSFMHHCAAGMHCTCWLAAILPFLAVVNKRVVAALRGKIRQGWHLILRFRVFVLGSLKLVCYILMAVLRLKRRLIVIILFSLQWLEIFSGCLGVLMCTQCITFIRKEVKSQLDKKVKIACLSELNTEYFDLLERIVWFLR